MTDTQSVLCPFCEAGREQIETFENMLMCMSCGAVFIIEGESTVIHEYDGGETDGDRLDVSNDDDPHYFDGDFPDHSEDERV